MTFTAQIAIRYPELTPVELRAGRWYKRDDLYAHPSGVNGGKWRQCRWLLQKAAEDGYQETVSGASILSPQLPMVATAAAELGMRCCLVIGGTHLRTASRQPGIRMAMEAGAEFVEVPVGYNPALQSRVRSIAEARRAHVLPYGIGVPDTSDPQTLLDFHMLGARETEAILEAQPATIIVPLGSGNSAAGIMLGLARLRPQLLRRVVLMGIGPSKHAWLCRRLGALEEVLGRPVINGVWGPVFDVVHIDLHSAGAVSYAQRVKFDADGLILHPTYEAKIAKWLEGHRGVVPGWDERDGSALFWVVGGPLRPRGAPAP